MAHQNQKHIGIELLRIVSMLMVLTLHLMLKGRFTESQNIAVSIESWILVFLSNGAVNCYVLISGYFLSEKTFKAKRVINTYAQTWFYSVLTFVFLVLIHGIEFSKGELLKSVFPLSFNNYWFVTKYLLLLLVSPIINIAIRNMTKKQMKLSLIMLAGIFCVLNTILTPLAVPFDGTGGFSLTWFIVLYFTGAYIKRFGFAIKSTGVCFGLSFGISFLCVALHYLSAGLNMSIIDTVLQNYNSILVYVGSICLFSAFMNLKLKENVIGKIVLKVAPLSFATYLIHESLGFKVYLWELININSLSLNGVSFIVFSIIICSCIFIVCALVESIRVFLFRFLRINRILFAISEKIDNTIVNL